MSSIHLPRWRDSYGYWSGFAFATTLIGGCILVATVLGVGLTLSMRVYGRTVCSQFGVQTGFQTKFEIIGWADSGTCLAKAPNGKWVLNSRITQFVGGKP